MTGPKVNTAVQIGPLPVAELRAGLEQSTAAFLLWLDRLRPTDEMMRAASELPGWSCGHVLTHVARNADGVVRTIGGVLRGQVLEPYAGGTPGRNQAIESGAGRSAEQIVQDVVESAQALTVLIDQVDEADAWALPNGLNRTMHFYLYARWRELEVHWVDLGWGYLPKDWPTTLVSAGVSEMARTRNVLAQVNEMTVPDWAKFCWLTGRFGHLRDLKDPLPDIDPWV